MKHLRNNSRVSLALKAGEHMCHIPMRQSAQWKEHSQRPPGNPDRSSILADAEHEDATSLKHQHQEMERSQESTGWVGLRDIIVSQKRSKDVSNRVTSSLSHTTQCWAKQNRRRKEIMNSKQKGRSEKRRNQKSYKKNHGTGNIKLYHFQFWHNNSLALPHQ